MFFGRPQMLDMRRKLEPLGHKLSDKALLRMLYRTNDADLALTALLLHPRPEWVEEIAGPHPDALSSVP